MDCPTGVSPWSCDVRVRGFMDWSAISNGIARSSLLILAEEKHQVAQIRNGDSARREVRLAARRMRPSQTAFRRRMRRLIHCGKRDLATDTYTVGDHLCRSTAVSASIERAQVPVRFLRKLDRFGFCHPASVKRPRNQSGRGLRRDPAARISTPLRARDPGK